jgi:YbbR domain-containing protein
MNSLLRTLQSLLERISHAPVIGKVIKFIREKKIIPKITCLLLATILWFYVDSKRINEAHFRILVAVDMLHDYAVADMEKKYLTVTARGSADDLRNILPSNISVTIKIQNPAVGTASRYPVSVVGSNLPDTVSLAPEDKTVFVTVEKRASKRVPVIPVTEGSLDSRFIAGNIRLVPDEVDISGATSVIAKIYKMETDPILLSGHTETFQQTVKLDLDDIKFCDVFQKQIDATVPLFELKGLSQVQAVPVLKGTVDTSDYTLHTKNVRVLVKNEKEESISPDDIEVLADISQFDQRMKIGDDITVTVPITVRTKIGKAVISASPDKIQLRIRKH